MSDDITPALSDEEWAEKTLWLHGEDTGPSVAVTDHGVVEIDNDDYYTRWHATLTSRAHGVAALCLYGKPFGFTADDVEIVRRFADGCDGTLGAADDYRVFPDGIVMYMRDVRRLASLADRIAALLPP